MNNSHDAKYHKGLILIHWIIALLIIMSIVIAFTMDDMPMSPSKIKLINWHKWLGISVLFLIIPRIILRFTTKIPALPNSMTDSQKKIAHLGHFALYGMMFIVPLVGWLMSSAHGYSINYFNLVQLPDLIQPNDSIKHFLKESHEILAFGLIGLTVGHVLVALKHQFIDKDNLLNRMKLK